MAFIYKITNDINDKVYIGKTLNSVEKRWKEHLRDYKKVKCEKRPLYSAMKKYGVEHFKIELLEECTDEVLSNRESYWINFYNSYHYGYNATIGGDGQPRVDRNTIGILWVFNNSVKDIQNITGYSVDTIRNTLYKFGIDKKYLIQRGHRVNCRPVSMLSKDGELLKNFSSISEAIRYLKQNSDYKFGSRYWGHISDACLGRRSTAYGYRWEYR